MHLAPVREGIPRGVLEGQNQLAYPGAALQQLGQQPLEFVHGRAVPPRRNLFDERPQRTLRKAFDPPQPRLEAVPPCDTGIDVVAPEDAAQWRIGKAPLASVEKVSLVNEAGGELAFARVPPESNLTAIGVARPFVQGEYPGEGVDVAHAPEHILWQVVVNLPFQRRHHVARSERQSGGEHGALAAELNAQIGRVLHQPRTHIHNGGHRNRQLDHLSQARAQPVIHQHPWVLWVICKFHNVVMSIGATHEMALRAAAHPADMLYRLYWHVGCPFRPRYATAACGWSC